MKADPTRFRVMAERCDECLFTPERVVSSARAAEIIKGCRQEDRHFVCHKATLAGGQNVCCRGFYDTQSVTVIHLAHILQNIDFVKEEDL